jgi:hypothetical protein
VLAARALRECARLLRVLPAQDGKLDLIDGLQRVGTLYAFITGALRGCGPLRAALITAAPLARISSRQRVHAGDDSKVEDAPTTLDLAAKVRPQRPSHAASEQAPSPHAYLSYGPATCSFACRVAPTSPH